MHYICSDIHGQYDLWIKLLEELNLQDDDVLYVLGDAIDRGPRNMDVLQSIMSIPQCVFFLGNHEVMMLDFLENTGDPNLWQLSNNGGRRTYREFTGLPKEKREEIVSFLHKAWIQKFVDIGDDRYALSHSAYARRSKSDNEGGTQGKDLRYDDVTSAEAFVAVWYSPWRTWEYRPEEAYDDGFIHVVGHVPVQRINEQEKPPYYGTLLKDRLINIDGGCALLPYGEEGGLYCMSLEKDQRGKRKEIWLPGKANRRR